MWQCHRMPSSVWKLVETAVETAGRGFASATALATSARLPELVPEQVPVALAAAAFKTFWMRLIGNLAALAALAAVLAADCWISAVTALCKVFATALQTANTISILWVYKKISELQWTLCKLKVLCSHWHTSNVSAECHQIASRAISRSCLAFGWPLHRQNPPPANVSGSNFRHRSQGHKDNPLSRLRIEK